jgi:integrase
LNGSGPPEDDRSFRPRMGRRNHPDREGVQPFYVRLARTAPRPAGKGVRARRARNQPGRVAVREPHDLSRRCVIKSKYVAMTADGRKLAARHLAYLERDGVERDGSPGRLYGPDDKFRADEFRERILQEPRQFRFIVSPQDGARVDLTEVARQLMCQVEKDTGRRLIWAAVNHYNTDNPHVHIVVRGVDRDGDEFRIDRGYHDRNWPRKWVARICKVAKVPTVSAHGMRGLHGTLAVETGLSAHAVAAALGHESVTTTLQSYAKSGAGAGARQERVLDVLKGGRMAS